MTKYFLPGGGVERGRGETCQAAAIRESYEETGVVVQLVAYAGDFVNRKTHARYYIGRAAAGSLRGVDLDGGGKVKIRRIPLAEAADMLQGPDRAAVLQLLEEYPQVRTREGVTDLFRKFDGLAPLREHYPGGQDHDQDSHGDWADGGGGGGDDSGGGPRPSSGIGSAFADAIVGATVGAATNTVAGKAAQITGAAVGAMADAAISYAMNKAALRQQQLRAEEHQPEETRERPITAPSLSALKDWVEAPADTPRRDIDKEAESVKPPLSPEEKEWLDGIMRDPNVTRELAVLGATTATKRKYFDQNTERYAEKRQRLHRQVVKELWKETAKPKPGKQPVLALLLGPPGSGKSTSVSPIADRGRGAKFWIESNADDAKEKLQIADFGSARPKLAATYHEESADVVEKRLIPKALKAGYNIKVDRVGKTPSKLMDLAEDAKRQGYRIELYAVQLPRLESAKRAVARWQGGDRFVNPSYIMNEVDGKPTFTYNALRATGLVDSWTMFSNDVPRRTPPILIDQGRARPRAL
jgi:ADP-ribose pyrophosphatase YjhB (NUDIX family)/predicted ABC-type ATPase